MSDVEDGVVMIHNKAYKTVSLRVKEFRAAYPDWTIKTKILNAAELVQVKASIHDGCGRLIASGHAEELRGSTNILKTSSVETCETSAVGRALAFLGMGGTEIASADEVANAITQQKEMEMVEKLKAHNEAVRENIDSITAIKSFILLKSWSEAYEAWHELTNEDKAALWIAPSNGGIFTTQERAAMKSSEWNEAKNDYHGES